MKQASKRPLAEDVHIKVLDRLLRKLNVTTSEFMQNAFTTIQNRCVENELSANPNKVDLIISPIKEG